MPQAIPAIIVAVASYAGVTGTALLVIKVVAAVATLAIAAQEAKAAEGKAKRRARSYPRDATIRSLTSPQNLIYGRARVGGPVVYANTCHSAGSTNNTDLWMVVAHAAHECDGFEDIWVDDKHTPASQITVGGGAVLSGSPYYNGGALAYFYERLGTSTQAVVSELQTNFPSDITSTWRGRGVAFTACRFILANNSRNMFTGAPQQIRRLVRGKKVYDPRRDPTSIHYDGSGSHSLTDPATWQWSMNPALCLADYLRDSNIGMNVADTEIDWAFVASAADHCDENSTTPAGTETRYTFNGVISAANSHRENIQDLLSSMNGRMNWAGGKFIVRAGAWPGVSMVIGVDDLAGDVSVRTTTPWQERFNTVRSIIYDAAQDYQESPVPAISSAAYLGRDGGEPLYADLELPGTSTVYMAQRLAFKRLSQSDRQMVVRLPMNLRGMRLAIGDIAAVTIDELGFNAKTFRCFGWQWDQEKGIEVSLIEDDEAAYADPLVADYVTPSDTAIPTTPAVQVPPPTALTAVAALEGIQLSWTPPENLLAVHHYDIYSSLSSAWAGASIVGSVSGTTFLHALASTVTRWYWVRAVDASGNVSIRSPNSDTSTVTATFTAGTTAVPSAPQSLGGIDGTPATGDLTGSFTRAGTTIASRVFTATHSGGNLTYSAGADTGEATTHSATGSGTPTLVVTHRHTGSGQTTTLTFTVAP